MSKDKPVTLEFSDKYDQQHSHQYLQKHQAGMARRLSNWRDMQLARNALEDAGNPNLVLDLPCGAGRFWPLLAEAPNRVILAADNSADMLTTAMAGQPADIVERVKTFQTSAFDIDLGDNAVDSIFCMRLIHHVAEHEHRLAMLRELCRVTRDTVIISLWVDVLRHAVQPEASHRRTRTASWSAATPSKASFVEPASLFSTTMTSCPATPCGASMCCARYAHEYRGRASRREAVQLQAIEL
jgi:ubiquinone/menaquinone biosynthesis C-methylase UbiE